jgi:hypothetical protein
MAELCVNFAKQNLGNRQPLSDEELLNAFNNPSLSDEGTIDYVEINDINGIVQGHHRINEIIRHANSPSCSITDEIIVRVKTYKRDLSMF